MLEISAALQSMTRMKHFNISSNNIAGSTVLGSAISRMANLLSLNISNNWLQQVGVTQIATSLKSLVQLQHLNARHNFACSGDCVKEWLPALQSMQFLTMLDLGAVTEYSSHTKDQISLAAPSARIIWK
mmetsp:Transcript_37722/g.100192  ORF Transcript_37722/g.100192 Transcript_37722/m.100192 type:complete len:129 (-) Transcript_37722:73-459(-)